MSDRSDLLLQPQFASKLLSGAGGLITEKNDADDVVQNIWDNQASAQYCAVG